MSARDHVKAGLEYTRAQYLSPSRPTDAGPIVDVAPPLHHGRWRTHCALCCGTRRDCTWFHETEALALGWAVEHEVDAHEETL